MWCEQRAGPGGAAEAEQPGAGSLAVAAEEEEQQTDQGINLTAAAGPVRSRFIHSPTRRDDLRRVGCDATCALQSSKSTSSGSFTAHYFCTLNSGRGWRPSCIHRRPPSLNTISYSKIFQSESC